MAQAGEAVTRAPAAGAAMDSNVLAIVVAATVSTSVFIVAILVLLLLLYHRDPLCCQFLCSCRFFQSPSQYDCPPPYFSSSQRLVGLQHGASRLESAAENPGMQGDELFCVGPPSSYQLPAWEEPRLPSYESVRKKDRQREIHQMIAERFGLWADPSQEMPPPYEHALRHPPAFSGTGISSETLDRLGMPVPFHDPVCYQTQRNTAVEQLNQRLSPRFATRRETHRQVGPSQWRLPSCSTGIKAEPPPNIPVCPE
ncbi:uncharacterized protein LOC112953741 [Nothoprocta perdicaria]|uniref:uncharacterized protein LOC112953741 n=1 Tax=Nothoprocta perdicaria TaxID=30464 RepID=UPI000E1BBF8E|nr:uncharacterized protein LOC112953741 [Nothoprocta perdicaria]